MTDESTRDLRARETPTLRPLSWSASALHETRSVTLAQALNAALRDALDADRRVVIYGADVGRLGGVFRVTDGLQERFGEERCFDTPVAESAIVGSALGMALYGLVPVVELQFDAFSYPAFEQIVSHVAKMRSRLTRASRAADHDPYPLRRPRRRARTPRGESRGLLRPYGRLEGRHPRDAQRRVLTAP